MNRSTADLIKKTAKKKAAPAATEPEDDFELDGNECAPSGKKALSQCFLRYTRREITIPRNFKHSTSIAEYNKQRARFDNIDSRITDENYTLATNMLVPGERYTIVVEHVSSVVNSNDCIKYIESKGGIFINAQGLAFIVMHFFDELPFNTWTVAFDRPQRLHVIDGTPRVAMIRRTPGQGHSIMLGDFSGKWRPRYNNEIGHAIIYAIKE